jgi:hypothetical protein
MPQARPDTAPKHSEKRADAARAPQRH